jgi:hypothetical protein
MPQTLEQIMTSLAGQYDPQEQLIQKQVDALPGQETAAVSGLEQARTNAFDGITKGANAKGMLYSGTPINDQNKYVGATYLPALAQVKQNTQDQSYKLQAALLGVRQDRGNRAQDIQMAQSKAEAEEASRQQSLALERQKLAVQQAAASAKVAAKEPSAASRQQSFNQDLMSAFQYASTNYKPFIREQVAQTLAANYGVTYGDALKQVQSLFTDGWDNQQQIANGYRKKK